MTHELQRGWHWWGLVHWGLAVQQWVGWWDQFMFTPWWWSVGLNRRVLLGVEHFEDHSVRQRVGWTWGHAVWRVVVVRCRFTRHIEYRIEIRKGSVPLLDGWSSINLHVLGKLSENRYLNYFMQANHAVAGALIAFNVMAVDGKRTAIGKPAQRWVVNPTNVFIGFRLF